METEDRLEKAKNEVLRKIGRNMLNFQKIEGMFKFLIANGSISGYASEIMDLKKQRAESIKKKTMGQLIGQFIEDTYSGNDKNKEAPTKLKAPHLSINFNIECEKSHYENKKQALALLVEQRNDLIHHLLPRFDSNSIESCKETEQYLELQHEMLLSEINELQSIGDSFLEGRKMLAEFLLSDEGRKHFELSELKERLERLLTEIASKAARKDGWTLLNTVGQHASEEIAELKKTLGHKTLEAMILATELFDINEEPTKKGGTRVLYRLKAD